MNKKQLAGSLIITVAVILFFVLFFAIKYSKNSNIIKVKAGNSFTITLNSNPTTGYRWKIAGPVDERLIKLLSSGYIAPETGLAGAPGKQEWVFKAITRGKVIIPFDYTRPWEKDAQPAETDNFFIIIN